MNSERCVCSAQIPSDEREAIHIHILRWSSRRTLNLKVASGVLQESCYHRCQLVPPFPPFPILTLTLMPLFECLCFHCCCSNNLQHLSSCQNLPLSTLANASILPNAEAPISLSRSGSHPKPTTAGLRLQALASRVAPATSQQHSQVIALLLIP